MKRFLPLLLGLILCAPALAQVPGGGGVNIGDPVTGSPCSAGQVIYKSATGKVACETVGGTGTVTSVDGSSSGSTLTATGGPVTTTGTLNFELNLSHANTWAAVQTFTNSDLKLLGSSTGGTVFTSDNSGASNFTMHLPAANDTLATLAAAQTLTNKTINGASNTLTVRLASDISGFGTGAATALGNAVNTSGGVSTGAAVLTANLPVIGGGSGTGLNVGTRSGNTTQYVTTTGTLTSGDCVKIDASGNFIANGSACGGGGGSLTVTDGTHSVASTTTLTVGQGFLVGGSAGNATLDTTVPNVTKTANFTLTAAEMSGQVNYNGSSITATIPAISSTIFASGMSSILTNRNATALSISTTPTINGCGASASLGTYGFMSLVSNGTSLDAACFPGYGTITNGALVKFSGTGGITTAADLTGDITTSGGVATTLATVNSNVGTFGDGTHVAQVTVNGKGLVTAASSVAITGAAASSITPGTTTIAGATAPCVIENSTSTTMACTAETGTGNFVRSASPTLTGTPLAPTAAVSTNTTQIATTAFVQAQTVTASLPVAWDSNTTVANATIPLFNPQWAGGGTITSVTYYTGTGSFTANVQIGGVGVTSCSALSISSSTATTTSCTAANTFTSSSKLTLVISGATATPNTALVQINMTHSIN